MNPIDPAPSTDRNQALRRLFLGGLLPVLAFTLVEAIYGTVGGLIAAVVFGAGEMIWEYRTLRKIQGITIGSNLLVLGLGAISLVDENSVWFKLQPAIILFVFAAFMIGSWAVGKAFLPALVKKQNPSFPEHIAEKMKGLTLRFGVALLALTALSVHAAYRWSTPAWATLKGVGVPLALFVYLAAEMLVIRYRIRR